MTDPARNQAEHWLPDEARVIALVRDAGSDDWASGVAIGLADMIGRARGRTYLANVAGRDDRIDALLNSSGGPGLTSALTGAATLTSIARQAPDQKFAFLPAGDAALPYSALSRMQAFRRFLARLKEGGGTLLLYVGAEDLIAPTGSRTSAERPTLDGCIALGEAGGLPTALGAPLLARVERPRPAKAADPAVALEVEDAPDPARDLEGVPEEQTRDGRSRAAGSLVRILGPMALAGVAWAALALATGGSPDPQPGTSRAESAVVGAAAADGDGSAPESASGSDAGSPQADSGGDVVASDAPPSDPPFSAPAARYSVLVGSYIRLNDALERRAELEDDGGLFFVAPTPVRGRTYYRVLAGVHEDRADAVAAMSALVEDGRKETMKDWDIRPVRLAFDLGTFGSRGDAERRVRELLAVDIPAYMLRDTMETPRYRVYAGAFTSASDAEPLGQTLAEREPDVTLEPRVGIAP